MKATLHINIPFLFVTSLTWEIMNCFQIDWLVFNFDNIQDLPKLTTLSLLTMLENLYGIIYQLMGTATIQTMIL